MTKKQKTERGIIAGVIIIIAVIGFSYLLGGSQSVDQKNRSAGDGQSILSNAPAQENIGGGSSLTEVLTVPYEGRVIFLQKNENTTDVFSQKYAEERKLVFTDQDEEEKIKSIANSTADGKILAVMAPANQAFGGSLYLIKTDGGGQKDKIIDDFASPQAPVISPDGKLIAYLLFSNAEADYGFTLYIMNARGQNKVEIDHDSTAIGHLTWGADAKSLAYIKGNNPSMTIVVSDSDGSIQKELYGLPVDKTANGLSWDTKNNLLLTTIDLKSGANSEIISINTGNGQQKTLLKNEAQSLSNAAWASEDQEKFFYLARQQRGESSAKLNISDLKNNITNIADSSLIIGWTK